MKITVKLVGLFRIERFNEDLLECPPGTKVAEVIDRLQLPEYLVGIILIDGVHAGKQDVLNDGDTLTLLPLLDGG